MITVERTFTVAEPVDVVVGYLEDFAHTVEWDPGTRSCVRQDDGRIRVGSSWVNVSEFRGRESELVYRLVRHEPRRLVFEGHHPKAVAVDDLAFTPTEGGTRLRYRATLRFRGWLRLATPLLRRDFARLADEVEESLPRVLARL